MLWKGRNSFKYCKFAVLGASSPLGRPRVDTLLEDCSRSLRTPFNVVVYQRIDSTTIRQCHTLNLDTYICHGDVNVDVYETRIGRNIISRPSCRITTQAHFTPSQELVMARVGMSLEPLRDFGTIGTEPDKEQKRLKPLEMFTWRLLCDASFQDALKEISPLPPPPAPRYRSAWDPFTAVQLLH